MPLSNRQATPGMESSLGPDLDGFIRELSENPEVAARSVPDLARRFQIPPEIVADVLEVLEVHRQSEAVQSFPGRVQALLERILGGLGWVGKEFSKLPFGFMAAMMGIAILAHRRMPIEAHATWKEVLLWICLTLATSGVLFFNRRIRYPLVGSLAVGIGILYHETGFQFSGEKLRTLEVSITTIGSAALFFVLTGAWSCWEWFRTQVFLQDPVAELGRQQMIARLVALQKQVESPKPFVATPSVLASPWAQLVRSLILLVGFGAGFLVRAIMQSEDAFRGPGITVAFIPIAAAVVGFFAVEIPMALLASVLLAIGFAVPDLFLTTKVSAGLVNPTALWTLAALFGFAGAVAAQAARGRHVRERHAIGDTASSVAEVVRIQRRIAAKAAHVCVMVVDVAGSTRMKTDANPLLAEYSFREYQRFVEEICTQNGGRIHSTAGDGAIVAFDSCRRAAASARDIQRGLDRFNREVNRLSKPFQLRIGLHVDIVPGDLRDVQFSRVIDIAAHVEGTAPVGGIALTDAVAKRLPGENLRPSLSAVDGFEIFTLPMVEAA